MRIGIDVRLWNQTGVGRYTRNLVRFLGQLDKKNQYFLFALRQDCAVIKSQLSALKYQNFKVIEANIKWHSIGEQLNFPKILYNENLDLVHFPYFSVPISYDKPFIVTIHDLIQLHFPTGRASTLPFPLYAIKHLGYKYVILKAANRAKKIIAVSRTTRDEIVDHLKVDPKKIEVVYEGADRDVLNIDVPAANTQRLIAKDYFLYVGNAYPHKNLYRLIQAFTILISQGFNISLVLVGKEDYFYKKLKKRVRKMNVYKFISFYGEATDIELKSLYKNAKGLIVPSLMEGFGLPALEAMVNKCLVLSSDIPALKEVCQDSAIYFDPYDESDMAEKMKIVYEKSFDREIIEKGFQRSKEFSWLKMAEETLAVYRQAV
ncbi:MAG: glycosyltransferase family 4 protein [Patescibacteria group bacterium]|nr:glycosyltransferase family 4 protein [Patescibacteria group bacterium]MCL6096504.1 glycosyltransferase family 4 protein [Patescibacteria group bacterium]